MRYILIPLIFISISCRGQYTATERSFIQIFTEFTVYLKQHPVDSGTVKYCTERFLFTGTKTINAEQYKVMQKQLQSFHTYLIQHQANMETFPAKFAKDRTIINQLTGFQKENCIILLDSSKKITAYILFMPATKGVIIEPRIWSWTLTFQFGKYMFRSVTGEDGYEFIFTPK